jgi:hypothetical protein
MPIRNFGAGTPKLNEGIILSGSATTSYVALYASGTIDVESISISGLSDSSEPGITFTEAGANRAKLFINSSNNLEVKQEYTNKHIVFKINDGGTTREAFRMDGAVPEVVVNQTGDSLVDFRVESDNNTHMIFVDGGNNKVGIDTSTPGSGLHVNSSFATAITGKSSDYTATASDHTILVDCSGGNVTITLPTAVGIAGRMYIIKRVDGSANAANINTNGSETIDGSGAGSVAGLGSIVLQSDNSNWWKVAEYISPP